MLEVAELPRRSMAQEPFHQGGSRTPRLEPRHDHTGDARAEQHLQAEEGEVERGARPPLRRPLDQRFPVECVRPALEYQKQVVVPEQAGERVMNGEMNGKIEEKVFGAEAAGVPAGHSERNRPIPDRQALRLVPRIPRITDESPVKIDANARRCFVERGAIEAEIELKAVRVGPPAIPEAEQEIVDALDRLPPDQQIEIGAGPQRRIRVERLGERRPFERDHRNVRAVEALEKSRQLAAQQQMPRGAVDEPLMDARSHRGRQPPSPIRLAREPEGRAHAFRGSQLKQPVPVERFARGCRRATSWEGAEALDDPARLGGQRVDADGCSIEAGTAEEPASCAFTSACSQWPGEGP
jgi:hypothetical protein